MSTPMTTTSFIRLSLSLTALVVMGCSRPEEVDTSPMKSVDPQARVENATKNIEASNMTPEQKQAALNYVKQGAAGAEQTKLNAEKAKSGGK